jgi:hypothetical protein
MRKSAEGACHYADQPVVDSDGSVYACCNTDAGRRTPGLRLGHLAGESFESISARADRNLVLQAIRVFGPARLAEIVRSRGFADRVAPPETFDSICTLCTHVMGQPDLVEVCHDALQQDDAMLELQLSRLLRYGEPQPVPQPTAVGDGRA